MDIKDQDIENLENKSSRSIVPWLVVILIAAWIIAIGILGAGWLISKELSKSNLQGSNSITDQSIDPITTPINIDLPDNKLLQGNADSKVTVIEFADFQCPYCKQWHDEIYPKLKSEFIDSSKIKFAFWDLAFLGDESVKSAEAALCANEQEKFWQYHDYLYSHQKGENQGTFADVNLKVFARDLGLDVKKFNTCFDSRTYKTAVEESTNKAGEYGVNSTPTIFINGLKFEGVMPWENYKQVIESELSK